VNPPESETQKKQSRKRSPRAPERKNTAEEKSPQKKRTPPKKNTTQNSQKDGRPKNDRVFMFEGKEYNTYSAMVEAKREHNKVWLENSGLLETAQRIKVSTEAQQSTALT
jgi:hypothetical protein